MFCFNSCMSLTVWLVLHVTITLATSTVPGNKEAIDKINADATAGMDKVSDAILPTLLGTSGSSSGVNVDTTGTGSYPVINTLPTGNGLTTGTGGGATVVGGGGALAGGGASSGAMGGGGSSGGTWSNGGGSTSAGGGAVVGSGWAGVGGVATSGAMGGGGSSWSNGGGSTSAGGAVVGGGVGSGGAGSLGVGSTGITSTMGGGVVSAGGTSTSGSFGSAGSGQTVGVSTTAGSNYGGSWLGSGWYGHGSGGGAYPMYNTGTFNTYGGQGGYYPGGWGQGDELLWRSIFNRGSGIPFNQWSPHAMNYGGQYNAQGYPQQRVNTPSYPVDNLWILVDPFDMF